MQDQIESDVIEILAMQALIDPASIAPDAALNSLGLDSLGLVEAIFAIEERFGVTVPFNANEPDTSDFDFSSVATVVNGVRRLVAARAG